MLKEFERYPKYKAAYIRAFERSCERTTRSKEDILRTYPGATNGEKVFNWWIKEPIPKYPSDSVEASYTHYNGEDEELPFSDAEPQE